jgi:hypothetical protein
VSEKEQVEALKLLVEFLAAARSNLPPPPELVEKTEKFLRLSSDNPPESHGQRRS